MSAEKYTSWMLVVFKIPISCLLIIIKLLWSSGLNRRVDGPQKRSGRRREENNFVLTGTRTSILWLSSL
jgi:hypothetical protein